MSPQLSPGITVRETDFSFYVKQISTSSAAMAGVAERGPINKPVLVTSWEQFMNTFGGYLAAGYLAYAARAFFDNGGAVLWVNRIAHLTDPTDRSTLTAEKSSATLTTRDLSATTGLATDRPATGTYTLSGGDDGLTDLSDIDYMGDPSQHTGFYAFDEIDALNILMAPGVTTAPLISGAIAYAESRKDLIFVMDAPIHLEP